MKKFLAILSFIAFVAVNSSIAQTASQDNKQTTEAKAKTAACTDHAKMSCCKKGDAKNCTAEQRAKCQADKSKAEAAAKSEAKKEKSNSAAQ